MSEEKRINLDLKLDLTEPTPIVACVVMLTVFLIATVWIYRGNTIGVMAIGIGFFITTIIVVITIPALLIRERRRSDD